MATKKRSEKPVNKQPVSKDVLNYQLEILKKEIDIINQSMHGIINLTQTIKGWAITVWMGSISLFIGQDISYYVVLSAIPPLLFWFVDAYWRTLQARYAFRASKIHSFLNSDALANSFEKGKLVNFDCFDTTGSVYRKSKDGEERDNYKTYTSLNRTLRMPEIIWFYLPLIVISLMLGMYFVASSQ